MPQTPGCAAPVPAASSPRTTPTPRARWWAGAATLASALLLAPAPASAQGAAQPMPPVAASAPDGTATTPTRMPRAGSSGSLEREGTGHAGRKTAQQRFEDANTTHDGHLTEAQAQAAHMRGVATHFAEIDSHHRGYITLDEIHSWRAERRAERKAAREKAAK
ncbi:MAG: hypothetical protein ACRYG6_06080 [Janthinobacterium lividum]